MSYQYSRQRGAGDSPEAWLMQLLSGFMVTQYIHVAAKLGLADRLHEGPRTAEELAADCSAEPRALYRLMRALASLGIFAEREDGRFEMTELAGPLRTGVAGSLSGIARMYGEEWFWRPYGELGHSVTTGQTAFDHVYGQDFYSYFATRPEAARIFDQAMSSFTGPQARAIVKEHDFRRFSRIMDVGGNRGVLLLEVLRESPQACGVLFDRADVVSAMAGRLPEIAEELGEGRLELVAGDFLHEIPSGCDAYLLRNVLQDWDDEQAGRLLANCRRAMGDNGTLLVIGRLIEPGNDPHPGKFTDLTMMVLTGGRERTLAETEALLSRAGLAVSAVTRTSAMVAVVEARRGGSR